MTEFIARLKKTKGIETVTLTTNGILLPNYIEQLSKAGIDGINISLDTLEEKKFRKLTRNGEVKDVWKGISSVIPYDQINMKINCVLAGKDWQKDAVHVAEIAKKYRIHVRFIELMPIQNQEEKGNLVRVSIMNCLSFVERLALLVQSVTNSVISATVYVSLVMENYGCACNQKMR